MEGESRNIFHARGRASTRGGGTTTERDHLLQWGNRKRLRCVNVHRRDVAATATATAERTATSQRRSATAALQHRILSRNSEAAANMISSTQQQHNNAVLMVTSLNMDLTVSSNKDNGNLSASPEDRKGSSSGNVGSMWPNFAIALTNKEEDFLMFKGSRPPHRPKKRTKIIQKTINIVCPGTWLCDLTLERYEVQEKKVSKKRPRGLKAMQSMDSDSE